MGHLQRGTVDWSLASRNVEHTEYAGLHPNEDLCTLAPPDVRKGRTFRPATASPPFDKHEPDSSRTRHGTLCYELRAYNIAVGAHLRRAAHEIVRRPMTRGAREHFATQRITSGKRGGGNGATDRIHLQT